MMSPLSIEWILLSLALSMSPDMDSTDLSRRIRNGDKKAFQFFFEEHHRALYLMLVRRGVEPQMAEDIIQNAFLFIWENRQKIDPEKSLRAYLFQIGYSRALNHFRDTKKFDYSDRTVDDVETTDPGRITEENQIREQIERAVSRLPEKRRQAFELCFMSGLTYREAAESLGVSVKTIENHMTLALKDLREALSQLKTDL